MADSKNEAAKALLAKTYDQMGYMSEAAIWRNAYLTAALELREGPPKLGISKANAIDMLTQVPTERFLEAMAGSLKAEDAAGKNLTINLQLTDTQESYVLWLENSVMHFKAAPAAVDANATLALTRGILIKVIAGTAGAKDTLLSDELKITGSKIDLVKFFALMDKSPGTFPIVTR
jgi:alkyl sulfatase BDS1-like metallo-beta-lactamase superfamily hydrolase